MRKFVIGLIFGALAVFTAAAPDTVGYTVDRVCQRLENLLHGRRMVPNSPKPKRVMPNPMAEDPVFPTGMYGRTS